MLKIVTNTLMLLMIGIISGFLFLIFIIYIFGKDLPNFDKLSYYQPRLVSKIYTSNGNFLEDYSNENRTFENNLKIIKDNVPSKHLSRIIMGIGAYNQNPRFAGQKIYRAGKYDFGGISIFSYTVFKEQPNYAKQIIKYLN